MLTVEPCCTQKHWLQVRGKIKDGKTAFFRGYGDLAVTDLLPVVLNRYADIDMLFVCPSIPDSLAEFILKWVKKKWLSTNGQNRINVFRHLTVLSDFDSRKSPAASKWLRDNPSPERMTLYNIQQNDTAIFFPDLVIYGNINLVPRGHFTAMVSGDKKFIENLKGVYMALAKR